MGRTGGGLDREDEMWSVYSKEDRRWSQQGRREVGHCFPRKLGGVLLVILQGNGGVVALVSVS